MANTVALDIGHGVDTFPPNKGVYKYEKSYAEHSFNAKLAVAVQRLLEANGINTVMYQEPNKPDVPLTKRTNYYNAKGVDLVWSIHANAGTSSVRGACAFYWHTAGKAKELAESFASNVRKSGYETHGNGTHASKVGDWTNLHICRETDMTAVLTENGFMTNDEDFELIFGSKQDEYIEDMAKVHAKTICDFFGVSFNEAHIDVEHTSRPSNKPSSKPKSKSIAKMADEVIAGTHGSGHGNRRKSLGVSKSTYAKVRAEVNRRAGISTPKPKRKSVSQMAKEVIAGKHGSGHATRRKSLGISSGLYSKVRAEVNRRAGGGRPQKSISQMANEVIAGKHGSGHANRRKSLGVSKSTYNKVRAEVNRRL